MKSLTIARAADEVLDLSREEHVEKLGTVIRIMSEQAVYAELASLARTAGTKQSPFRPLDPAARPT
jgi:hypothetical protein